jgi:multidrug efflux pump
MFLPRVSIQRPVLASMMSLSLVLFGLIGLSRLPVRELPDIDPPIVSVTTVYPGANASVVESEVTERIEEAVNNIQGVKTLSSSSREQVSSIVLEFDLSRDIEVAAQDVRDRLARVRGGLPRSVLEPTVAKAESDAQAFLWISLRSDRYSPLQLTTLAEQQIKNRLQTVPGVSSIIIGGEQRFAMRLWLDSERMAARQVTVLDVSRALRQQNVELPSGRVENLYREMTIETLGELKTAEEFNRLILRNDGAKVVRLRDIGIAKEGVENERTIARSNGKPCIFLGIVKQAKANTVEVARGIKAELEKIRPSLPPGIEANVNYDESTFVERAIREVWVTLGIAFGLVVLIIFVFLRNVRSTIIPTVAIPVSIVATFAILQLLGYSINILTMLALVLAIGVVVDDAIVVLENIYRHIEAGLPPMQAAFKAMEEISFAIIAITISLVAVFLPLAFQKGSTGRLFTEFAVAVAGSVTISAFVALSLSPMMAARILKPIHTVQHGPLFLSFERGFHALNRLYRSSLLWALRHRIVITIITLAIVALTVLTYQKLDKEFMPDEDKGRIFCFMQAPEGSTSEYTDRMIRQMESIVDQTPETKHYIAIVAPGGNAPGQASQGILFITLKDERERTVQEILGGPQGMRSRFITEVEGALAFPSIPKSIGWGSGAPFQLMIQNQDLNELHLTANAIADRLRASGYLENVRSSFEVNKAELRVNIDRDRAAALGVSIEDIASTMQILFGGLDLSRIKTGGKEYKVIAQLDRAFRLRPQDLDRLYVRNAQGALIQLSSIVKYTTGAAPNTISHFARLRTATISGTPVGVPIGTAMERTEEMLKAELPAGFLHTWGGEARDLKDANREIWWVLGLAVIIVYMVLAAQFESLIHPFTVMLALPLAGVGAFGLLWFLNWLGKTNLITPLPAMNLNLFSQIGLILLIGLVTKNSILLVEFANQRRAEGVASHDAMIEAGVVRLRPILMTALSTVAGILPIAIGFGAGAESRRPMGVAVVGGMISSTFLTLFVVPVVYTALSDLNAKLLRKSAKRQTAPA